MPRNLSGSIALSKMKHVLLEMPSSKVNEDGTERVANDKKPPAKVKGIWIPFEANKLDIYEKPVEGGGVETQIYMPARVHIKDEEDQNGQIGFISKSLATKDYKALGTGDVAKKAAAEFTPILGSLKEFTNSGTANDAEGNVGGGETFTPTDDVPF